MRSLPIRLFVLLLVATLGFAACGSSNDDEPNPDPGAGGIPAQSAAAGEECAVDNLPLSNAGELTIATDKPAFPPWFEDNDPTNGKGFESAVAYAIAEEMGFSGDQVKWVVEPFNKSYAPGPKEFDFDINQISITPKRDEAVDFSAGYYNVNQALITLKDSPIAESTSLDELRDAKLGAQVGTTSLAYIQQYVVPNQQPFVYDSTSDARSALRAGQIDGIVADLPTAFFITAVQIPGSTVAGQFPTQDVTEQFGLLFEDGNPLVSCVDAAIAALEKDGTLDSIQDEWLSQAVDAPVFE
ncbi:MAG: polar amino acid transport system substrate-binding protein [Actinomycetota bacterium]|nr:polar amino acid transport system substrate-binding protein [Actinomycetota bacterium]